MPAPSELEVVLVKMLSDRSGLWQKTDERKRELFAFMQTLVFETLPHDAQATIKAMLDEAVVNSSRFWVTTAERMRAVHAALLQIRKPNDTHVQAVLDELRRGAVVDGVAAKPWVAKVETFLRGLLKKQVDEGEDEQGV